LNCRRLNFQTSLIFLVFLLLPVFSAAAEERVSIYDDFDDGAYGQSVHRSVFRSANLSAFTRSETLPVRTPSWDRSSLLTAVVLSAQRAGELKEGLYSDRVSYSEGIFSYEWEGIEFSFSLEKPSREIMILLEDYYRGPYSEWLEPLKTHYEENYVIRIHSAENIFEPWKDEISYDEVLLMATLLGDRDQWLWGIHNGSDLLNR